MKCRYGWLLIFIVLLFTTNVSAYSENFNTGSSDWGLPSGFSISNLNTPLWDSYALYGTDTVVGGRSTYYNTTIQTYLGFYFEMNNAAGQESAGGMSFGWGRANSSETDNSVCSGATDYLGICTYGATSIVAIGFSGTTINGLANKNWYHVEIVRSGGNIHWTVTNESSSVVMIDETVAYSDDNYDRLFFGVATGSASVDDIDTGVSDPALPTSGVIQFDASNYDIDDAFDVTATLTNPDYDYYLYYYDLVDPNGVVRETGQIYEGASFPGHDTSDTLADIPGTWQIELYGCGLGICWANRVDLDSDTTQVSGGTGAYASYIFLNKVNYDLSEVANITYSIDNENWTASPWGTNFRIEIVDNEGKGFFDLQLAEQNGSIDYVFPETGVYKVNLVKRSWGVFGSIIAYDGATVTEDLVDADGYGLKVSPTTINCGGTMYFTVYSENPSLYDTYLNVTNATTTISSVEITSNPASFSLTFGTYSGSYYAKVMNGTTVEKQQLIKINTCYGSGNNGDGIAPGSGFGDGSTYTSDTAFSNAQQNFINFIAYPIFWGLLILIVIVMVLALNHYGDAIPYVVPVVVFFELVIGLLEPYTAFIGVAMVVFIVGMILIKQRS